MLARAADKGVYDALTQGDIIEFLMAAPPPCDLICCLDTLSYFGDLRLALGRMARALKPGGLLLFSIERALQPLPDGHRLQPCGRYLHDPDWVEVRLADYGLRLEERRDMMLREEAGRRCPALLLRRAHALSRAAAQCLLCISLSVQAITSADSRKVQWITTCHITPCSVSGLPGRPDWTR